MKKTILFISLALSSMLFAQEVEEVIIREAIDTEEYEIPKPVKIMRAVRETEIITGKIGNTLLIFKKGEKYGLKNKKNETLVDAVFYSVNNYESTDNRIIVSKSYSEWGVINPQGKIIIPIEKSSVSTINNNFVAVNKNQNYSLFDFNGNLLLKDYENIRRLNYSRFYSVKQNGFYGVVSPSGSHFIPTEYDEISYFSNYEWFSLKQNGRSIIKNLKGEQLFSEYENIEMISYSGILKVSKNGKYGIINTRGNTILPTKYEDIKNYDTSYALKEKGKWGLYNLEANKFSIAPKYDNIKPIGNSYLVQKGDKKTLINLIYDTKFDISGYDVYRYSDFPFYRILKGELKGFIDVAKSKIIIPVKYTELDKYTDAKTFVGSKNNKFDLYNFSGKLIDKNVSEVKSLPNQYMKFSKNGKAGLIYKGDIILKTTYDLIMTYDKVQVILVKKNGKYALLNSFDLKEVIPYNKDRIYIKENEKSHVIQHKNKKYTYSLGKLYELK